MPSGWILCEKNKISSFACIAVLQNVHNVRAPRKKHIFPVRNSLGCAVWPLMEIRNRLKGKQNETSETRRGPESRSEKKQTFNINGN